MPDRINVAVLGSTGSIGTNALSVLRELEQFRLYGISGHSNIELLRTQAEEFSPEYVVVTGDEKSLADRDTFGGNWRVGCEHLDALASNPNVQIVVASIVGQAGLSSALAAANSGKRLALANKEALVVAGEMLTTLARRSGAELIPIDSEHSAIWQAALAGKRPEIRQIILTASGGPFHGLSEQQLQEVTVERALAHPNWSMGQKITIDSATLLNKALEIVEAKWLFGLEPDQIRVLVHPQSIIHSMVEFADGSVVAQLGSPDMKLPIQYALTYPERVGGPAERMDWSRTWQLDLIPPNAIQAAALELGFEVCRQGGTAGAVLNAANEVAVSAFLQNKISFAKIVPACREILEQHQLVTSPNYDQLMVADNWAREEMNKWICS